MCVDDYRNRARLMADPFFLGGGRAVKTNFHQKMLNRSLAFFTTVRTRESVAIHGVVSGFSGHPQKRVRTTESLVLVHRAIQRGEGSGQSKIWPKNHEISSETVGIVDIV